MIAPFDAAPAQDAIPIAFVTKETWPTLRDALSDQARQFAAANNYQAKPGEFLTLPASDGGIGQVLGLAVGLALSLVLIYVVNVQSFGWTIQFHLPWGFLAQSTALIVIATGLAGLYPARRAARLTLKEDE